MGKSLDIVEEYLKSNPLRRLYLLRISGYSVILIAAFIFYFLNVNIDWYSRFFNDNIQCAFLWLSSWFCWFIPLLYFIYICFECLFSLLINRKIKNDEKFDVDRWYTNKNTSIHCVHIIYRLLYFFIAVFFLLMALEKQTVDEFPIYVFISLFGYVFAWFSRTHSYYYNMFHKDEKNIINKTNAKNN